MHEVIMPKLGLTMESGKIEKWHKKEGELVESGDILFEVMTDKVSLEVESYNSGILRKILHGEGEEVPVTEIVAYIGSEDEEIPGEGKQGSVQEPAAKEKQKMPQEKNLEETENLKGSGEAGKVLASPLARKIASENDIDLSLVKGSGPRGRIVKEDVEAYIGNIKVESAKEETPGRIRISPLARKTASELGIDYKNEKIKGTGPGGRIVKEDILGYAKDKKQSPTVSAPPGQPAVMSSVKLTGMRKIIAQRMSQSKSTIPHIVLSAKADTTDLIDLRNRLKDTLDSKYGVKITYTDFILKACSLALREFIEVNSSLQEENYIIYDDVNVGMAVSVENGLIVPTIFNTDKMEIVEIAKKRVELVEKAKNSRLTLEEITNGTFTVTNLGMFGVRNFSAIINPPQSAILAVGEFYQEPAVVDGKIIPRSFTELSLSCDHRIIDGALGARFLHKIVEFIENPVMLLI